MKKLLNKKTAIIAIVVAIAFAIVISVLNTKAKDLESLSGNEGPMWTATIKNEEISVSPHDTEEERAFAYARNIYVAENGELKVTGAGTVTVNGGSAVYEESGFTLAISTLGTGQVSVIVSKGGNTVALSFNATEGPSSGESHYSGPAYAAGITDGGNRDIRDESHGYHENVVDTEGNIAGSIGREEISGTVEADKKADNINQNAGSTVVKPEEGYSKPTSKPVAPEVEVKPQPKPEDKPALPQTGENTPAPEVKPEVVPTPEVQPQPEPPVVDKDSVMGQVQQEADQNNMVINASCEVFIILPADGGDAIVYFGNGSGEIVVETAVVTDLGNGFVKIAGYDGVFKK